MSEFPPRLINKQDIHSGIFLDFDENAKIPFSEANLIPSFDELEIQAKINPAPEKIFLSKFEDDLLDKIKSQPYFKITEMVNNCGGQIANRLISMSHNRQMLDI